MDLSIAQIIFIVLLGPAAVYGLARLVFAAYFSAKAVFLKRYFHGTGKVDDE